MLIFLHGPDTYRSKQRLRTLREAFREKYDQDGQSIVQLSGAELTLEQFRQAVHTVGLFSQRRCVILDQAIGSAKPAVQESIATALENDIVPKDFVVLFWEAELPARGIGTLQKYLQKQKTEAFPLLDAGQLAAWIRNHVKEAQAAIEAAAVKMLADRVGPDLWRMQSELEKLIAQAGDKPISADLVKELPGRSDEVNVFAFGDALVSRNTSQAILELQRLIHDGTHPLALVQMIARQLQNLLLVEEASRDTQNSATIAKRLGLHPFVAKKTLAQVTRFRSDELLRLHERLVDLDYKLKSSRVDPMALLEEYVLSFTSKRPS